MADDRKWFESDLLERFDRYVRVHTTSDSHSSSTPSTDRQFDLARMLESELRDLGLTDVDLDDSCCLIARLPGNSAGTPVGFMAHVDTAPDFTGENVHPQLHQNYDGKKIQLGDHYLDPEKYPNLKQYEGETVITTDGTTLLGADDKAGIAEIMTATRYLLEHEEIARPPIEIIFTPDEEIGRGMDNFPVKKLQSTYCFTLDGSDEGSIEAECFTAFKATVTCTGYLIHPGTARGKLANANTMVANFIAMLPRNESPEATDGAFGFYCPGEISSTMGTATAEILIRDFDMATARRRIEYLESLAKTIEGAFPGGFVAVKAEQQYLNMAEYLTQHPSVIERLSHAIRETGIEPVIRQIRGGTDGARLCEMGIPTPNIFAGGQALHGRHEWIALPAMVRAAKTIVNLAQGFTTDVSAST